MHQGGRDKPSKEREQVEERSQGNVLDKTKRQVTAETQREGVVGA